MYKTRKNFNKKPSQTEDNPFAAFEPKEEAAESEPDAQQEGMLASNHPEIVEIILRLMKFAHACPWFHYEEIKKLFEYLVRGYKLGAYQEKRVLNLFQLLDKAADMQLEDKKFLEKFKSQNCEEQESYDDDSISDWLRSCEKIQDPEKEEVLAQRIERHKAQAEKYNIPNFKIGKDYKISSIEVWAHGDRVYLASGDVCCCVLYRASDEEWEQFTGWKKHD